MDMLGTAGISSSMCRGIVKGAELISRGARVATGNGARTLFWGEHSLSREAINPIPDALLGAMVQELWDGTDWKWDLISPFVADDIRGQLRSIFPTGEGV